jgi:hypothetical protein
MADYAVVKSGVVENIVVWDGQTAFSVEGAELVEATSDTRIGGTYDGSFHFVEPPIPEPTAEEAAKQDRVASVKSKLEALGLTTEEVQDAFGI